MRTNLFKTYSEAAHYGYSIPVYVGPSNTKMFALLNDVVDDGRNIIHQRSFSRMEGQVRTFYIFHTKSGDYGYRWFEEGYENVCGSSNRIFADIDSAFIHFNTIVGRYATDVMRDGWKEVI